MDDSLWETAEILNTEEIKNQLAGSITQHALEFLESYGAQAGNNLALAVVIESLSESLGNLISLVAEAHQSEVIVTANQVILQGIVSQHKMLAHVMYGHVGTA